jgi:ubiquinone/menaquinone biosynthesis C-methylase UbiE
MIHKWMIDELSFAGPEHLDAQFVGGYDRKQGRPDPAKDIAVFEAHGLGPGSTVVDLAAGTGQFARAAAEHFGRVVAVDISPVMLEQLRATSPATVEAVRAGFLSYEHEGLADGVFTRNGLHQLPDFFKAVALQRIADMLRPGGVLRVRDLIYDFAPSEAESVFAGWFANASTDPSAGYTEQDYVEHIRTEFSTFRWLFEPMLTAAGFAIVDVAYHGRVFGAYTCVKR